MNENTRFTLRQVAMLTELEDRLIAKGKPGLRDTLQQLITRYYKQHPQNFADHLSVFVGFTRHEIHSLLDGVSWEEYEAALPARPPPPPVGNFRELILVDPRIPIAGLVDTLGLRFLQLEEPFDTYRDMYERPRKPYWVWGQLGVMHPGCSVAMAEARYLEHERGMTLREAIFCLVAQPWDTRLRERAILGGSHHQASKLIVPTMYDSDEFTACSGFGKTRRDKVMEGVGVATVWCPKTST